MNQHEQKLFVATLVAAFRSTQLYMKRNYLPGKVLEKGTRRS